MKQQKNVYFLENSLGKTGSILNTAEKVNKQKNGSFWFLIFDYYYYFFFLELGYLEHVLFKLVFKYWVEGQRLPFPQIIENYKTRTLGTPVRVIYVDWQRISICAPKPKPQKKIESISSLVEKVVFLESQNPYLTQNDLNIKLNTEADRRL